ncbi:MAG: anhydro-N-acetylmuramic acid kinase [Giesbergeria sp.]|jgi:anhydro-N-acetylmuramic acid kinase|nr:anhydro-N-acetylmuramic acid kinase [Giesbergeria sp.]
MSELYIGLMSGTSLDGVDAVLADLSGPRCTVLHHHAVPFDTATRVELLALNTPGANELQRAALAANALARSYAAAVQALLAQAGVPPTTVRAIGAHGQTVRHRPGEFDGTGYTLQINQPALLAELTGITVVADFRSRDVAAGGQGAPLVPAFHQHMFGQPGQGLLVLNVGGIANLSVLGADGSVLGFDCGPGNALMDHWCQRHTGQPFDRDGTWAASGRMLPELLAILEDEPFLRQPPPKSTGRDLFNPSWLQQRLDRLGPAAPEDVQATLTELTAKACAASASSYQKESGMLAVCGGGAFNRHLMARLHALLPGLRVDTTAAHGLPPLQVEAAAFAWLARQTLHGLPGNLPSATGARGARVLGGIYPA